MPLRKNQVEADDQIHVDCGVCGSDQCETVHHFPKEYFDPTWFDTFPWDGNLGLELKIVKCKDCGLVYQNPRFSEESIGHLYPNHPLPNKLDYSRLMRNHKFGFFLNLVREYS